MRISDWSSDVCSSDLNLAIVSIRRAVAKVTGAQDQIDIARLRRGESESGIVAQGHTGPRLPADRIESLLGVGKAAPRIGLRGDGQNLALAGRVRLGGEGVHNPSFQKTKRAWTSRRAEERGVGKECVSTCRYR